MVSIDELLRFIDAFINEENPHVWAELSSSLIYLAGVLKDSKFVQKIKQLTAKLFKPIAQRVGWKEVDGESKIKFLIFYFFKKTNILSINIGNLVKMCREIVLYTSVVSSSDNQFLETNDFKELREAFTAGQAIPANTKKPV